jgi:dihydroorotate dehydrogenase
MRFLNHELKGRVIAASCPATENIDNIVRCAENGASAVILKSASSTRLGDTGTRRCYIDSTGFWTESSFDREIMPLNEAANLVKAANVSTDVLVISSVTEMTLEIDKWLNSCFILEQAGAGALQLDFFYLPNLLMEVDFASKFVRLIREICSNTSIPIMPKLNIGIPVEYSAHLLTQADVEYVSLLDSIRSPAPVDALNLSGKGLSVFGTYMLPITRRYTDILSKTGLKVCAGGGITNGKAAADLIHLGASTVQIATEVLLNGFNRFSEIEAEMQLHLQTPVSSQGFKPFNVTLNVAKCNNCDKCRIQTFCATARKLDITNDGCEGCGLCLKLCPSEAIIKTDE